MLWLSSFTSHILQHVSESMHSVFELLIYLHSRTLFSFLFLPFFCFFHLHLCLAEESVTITGSHVPGMQPGTEVFPWRPRVQLSLLGVHYHTTNEVHERPWAV